MYEAKVAQDAGYTRGAMFGSGLQAAEAVQRQAEIPAQADRLDRALKMQDDTIRELVARLEPLLRPQMPEPASTSGNQIAAAPPMTPAGAQLYDFNARLNNLTDRLQDVLRRLEV